MSELAQKHAERRAIRARFAGVFDEAVALFYEVDPVGINFGVNPEEYVPEVCTALPRMETAGSLDDVVRILSEEFERWFSASGTGLARKFT